MADTTVRGIIGAKVYPPLLKMDNQSTIALSKNHVSFVNVWRMGRSTWIM